MIPMSDLADAPQVPELAPIAAGERFDSIDLLRGFVLLGILVMNIVSFGLPGAAYMNPTALGPLGGADEATWLTSHLLADMKFMSTFSMLFGVGIVVMDDRAARRGRSSAGIHYRRMGWLMLFGLLHAHLLWFGDILWPYALCGLVAWPLRRLPSAALIPIGLVLIAIGGAVMGGFGVLMGFVPEEAQVKQAAEWAPGAEKIAREIATYRGSWLEQMTLRVPTARVMETFMMLILGPRILGLMLIGMVLMRLRFVTGERGRGLYVAVAAIGVALGLAMTALGVAYMRSIDWQFPNAMFYGWLFNYAGSVPQAIGYVAIAMLVAGSAVARPLLAPIRAVGRTALSNYLLQTVICTTIFYGHGLGLYARLGRAELLLVVLGVWAIQLVLSPFWLSRFRFGPAEWVWRSLVYLRAQPMRRG